MKGGDYIDPDRLEETLSCDDIFLQYFNTFLDLPIDNLSVFALVAIPRHKSRLPDIFSIGHNEAFPLRLQYDRLTGTFHELGSERGPWKENSPKSTKSTLGLLQASLPGTVHGLYGNALFGARDDERERLLNWTRENRLPLFTQELRLCKLLLRPLDYRRGSSRIRGYSRLSMGTTGTTYVSPAPDNQSSVWNDGHNIKQVASDMSTPDRSRPTSQTQSLPVSSAGFGKSWPVPITYNPTATEAIMSTEDNVSAWQNHNENHHRFRSRRLGDGAIRSEVGLEPLADRQRLEMSNNLRKQDEMTTHGVSDSGIGTTALDHSTTVGTSGKTRNVVTRADTLGVSSQWESEVGYSTMTPDTRTHTGLTSPSVLEEDMEFAAETSVRITGNRYEGKSALRTADSPSKRHRATIVLPRAIKNGNVSVIGGASTDTISRQPREVEERSYESDIDEDDTIDDDDDVSAFLFDEGDSSCDETETEIASIQKVHSMKLQHIKERLLGTKQGMDSLLNFLSDTAGINLVSFWLDAEAFKDVLVLSEGDSRHINGRHSELTFTSPESAPADEGVALAWRHRLFRDILDRHKLTLTEEATEQIREAQSNLGLTCHVFGRTQYDALRRLRSYWLPRYIVHCSSWPDFEKRLATGLWDVDRSDKKPPSSGPSFPPLLPISHLVPNWHLCIAKDGSIDETDVAVRPLESPQDSTKWLDRPTTTQIRAMSARSASNHLLLRALASEANAGFPFREYLRREQAVAKNAYDFWMMLEYPSSWTLVSKTETKPTQNMSLLKSGTLGGDFRFDAQDAWKLFRNFVWPSNVPRSVDLPSKMHTYARTLDAWLRKTTDAQKIRSSVPSSVFHPAKLHALSILSDCWNNYRKRESMTFSEARTGHPASTDDTIERPVSPPVRTKQAPPKHIDDASTTLSETTTIFGKPWLTDDDTTETDSASTMYSYDVERIRQIAAIIRQKGAKKPQTVPTKRTTLRRRTTTATRRQAEKPKNIKDTEVESVSSKTSKKKQTKVQFSIPEKHESPHTPTSGDTEAKETKAENAEGDGEGAVEKSKRSLLHRHPNKMTYQELKDNKLQMYFRKYVAQCESMEVQNVLQMHALCDALRAVPLSEVDRRSALANELNRTYLSSSGPKQIAMSTELSASFTKELPNPSFEVAEALQSYVLPTLNQAAANFSIGFGAALKEYKLDIRSDLIQNATKADLALRTLTLKPSSKRRRALGKHSARQPPTADHKQSFMDALARAAEGNLPIDLLHFYKYLQGFGSQEGFPLIHNDLLFYVEVSKFVACFHEAYDLVTLKRKVQSIIDCFITSDMEPTLQIDIKTGTAERLRRAADSFTNDKGRDPHTVALFDDSRHTVFNELLPFWAGFASARPLAERDEKRPVLKSERLHKRRLEAFLKTPEPKRDFSIPKSAPKFDMHGLEFTFSVNGGIQWKEWSDVSSSSSSSPPPEGLIEIVKMPPRGQARRMIRRGNFSVKKLASVQEKPGSTKASKQQRQHPPDYSRTKGGRGKGNTKWSRLQPAGAISYTTSVT